MVERNALCHCGSGKKYKKCCLIQEELQQHSNNLDTDIAIKKMISSQIKESNTKHCLHPKQNECSGGIVNAHSIQNNRILNAISHKGIVKMIKPQITNGIMLAKMSDVGRGQATTFSGFCGFHDKVTFQPIEDCPYQGTNQQTFLLAYRAFAFDYHAKYQQAHATKSAIERHSQSESALYKKFIHDNEFALSNLNRVKEQFDQSIITADYDVINGLELKLPGCARIAVCSSYWLKYDLVGNKINNDSCDDGNQFKYVFVNIFPQDAFTYVNISWLKGDDDYFDKFRYQLNSLQIQDQLRILNNLIPLYSENFALHPELWNSYTKIQKEELESVFSQVYAVSPHDLTKNRRYDLFKDLSSST